MKENREPINLTFKTKSLLGFVKDYYKGNINELCLRSDFSERTELSDVNWKNFFRDLIYIKKDNGIESGDKIQFELEDISAVSNQKLVNIYTYNVHHYDSATLELRLIYFKIEVVKN
jgi:hypothetical protein